MVEADPDVRYTLVGGLRVVDRAPGSVQIGTEPALRAVLADAPAESLRVLRELDGRAPLRTVVQQHGGRLDVWLPVVTRLLELGAVVPAADWVFPGLVADRHVDAERNSLVHRWGLATARRVLSGRQEARVAVRGDGDPFETTDTVDAVARLLERCGVGAVERGVQAADRRRAAAVVAAPVAGPPPGTGERLAGPGVPRRPPARGPRRGPGRRRPDVVVLVGAAAPPPWSAADLAAEGIPHLAVRLGLTSASVGPFVLPGRSSCLLCVARHRQDRDPQWTLVQARLRDQPVAAPAALAASVAAATAAEVLAVLDGLDVPTTVDGGLEWTVGAPGPRRRSWPAHPECTCRRTGAPVPDKSGARPAPVG
ncbi:hypothetical protein [Nakamurella endophytica]|uniref:Thiamin biosynthesis protein n=1 Tax=Nakamurella endophytica TaxID=1748367 RepID=A0A917T2A8_9ACTN|nr:hypothetical protein [Nakamurella endophytica]GGM07897.1 thiamin biosynthesis protein [Nakamurella endophytica]